MPEDNPLLAQAGKIAESFLADRHIPEAPSAEFIRHLTRDAIFSALHLIAPEGLSDREEALLDISMWQPGSFLTRDEWSQALQERAREVVKPLMVVEPSCGQCGSSDIVSGYLTAASPSAAGAPTPMTAMWKCNHCGWQVTSTDGEGAKRQFETGALDPQPEAEAEEDGPDLHIGDGTTMGGNLILNPNAEEGDDGAS